MSSLPSVDRSATRICRLEEQGADQRVVDLDAVERLNLVWPLTVAAWSIWEPDVAQSRLQRHVVGIHRREG